MSWNLKKNRTYYLLGAGVYYFNDNSKYDGDFVHVNSFFWVQIKEIFIYYYFLG